MKFFGIDKDSRRVVVYLSSLFVARGKALDFRGQARSYEGITVPIEEFSIGAALPKAFKIDPFDNIPPIIRRNLQKKWSFFKPTSIDVNASPFREADIDFSTRSIITLGSHGYNLVTDYCTAHGLTQLHITHDGTAITIVEGRHQGEVIRPASSRHDIAILEKLIDSSQDQTTLIIAAGLGVIGTMGAVRYLIDNWEALYKSCGDNPFGLVLQFGPVDAAPLVEVLKGNVIRRLPED